jgi:protease I
VASRPDRANWSAARSFTGPILRKPVRRGTGTGCAVTAGPATAIRPVSEAQHGRRLHGRRVAILATDGVERVELEQPRSALHDAAAQTDLLSLHGGEIQARNNDLDPAGTFGVDGLVADAAVDDYDALLLPGGTVNPDRLRMDRAAVGFVRDFVGSGKPVAAICHGPWTLLEAGAVRGRTITSFPSLRTDLRNAGANVVDQEVARDGTIVTSRSPKDLPAFCSAIVELFAGTPARSGDRTGTSS